LLVILNIQYGTEVSNRFCGVNAQELATTLTLKARKNCLLSVPDLFPPNDERMVGKES